MNKSFIVVLCLVALLAVVIAIRSYKNIGSIREAEAATPTSSAQTEGFDFQKWHEYTSHSNDFKAIFPTLPQHVAGWVSDPKTKIRRKYEMYFSTKDNMVFMVNLITDPKDQGNENEEGRLNDAVNQILSGSPDNKLKDMTFGTFKDHRSVNFQIQGSEGSLVVGKAIFVKPSLYMLTVTSKESDYQPKEYDFFTNSFVLIPAQENKSNAPTKTK